MPYKLPTVKAPRPREPVYQRSSNELNLNDDQGELRVEQKPSLLTKAIHENVSNIVDKELPELEQELKSAKKKVSVIEKRIAERRELVDEAIKKFGHPIPPSPFEVLHS
ncbi:hypothetical protein MOC68_13590 [Bacillus spizizenii]|nr:hypothetical protein [Bacillus spizizenii]